MYRGKGRYTKKVFEYNVMTALLQCAEYLEDLGSDGSGSGGQECFLENRAIN